MKITFPPTKSVFATFGESVVSLGDNSPIYAKLQPWRGR